MNDRPATPRSAKTPPALPSWARRTSTATRRAARPRRHVSPLATRPARRLSPAEDPITQVAPNPLPEEDRATVIVLNPLQSDQATAIAHNPLSARARGTIIGPNLLLASDVVEHATPLLANNPAKVVVSLRNSPPVPTQLQSASETRLEACDLDEETKVFRAPFLAAS